MYYFKLIFLLFLPLNLFAQNSFPSQVKSIDLSQINQSERKLKLSDNAESISYVQLSRDIPLAEINYIKSIDNGEFLIYSNSMVCRFDKNGKYINSLFKSGRGPMDVVCQTILLDKHCDNNIVFVLCYHNFQAASQACCFFAKLSKRTIFISV